MDRDAHKVAELLASMTETSDADGPALAELLTALSKHNYNVAAAIASISHDS